MYKISSAITDDIKHLIPEAKKSGLLFPKKTARFVVMKYYDEIIGFAGMLLYKNKAVLKLSYVMPQHRNKGLATELLITRLMLLKGMDYKRIEANCTDMSLGLHLKQGAKIKEKFKNGITKVVYENLQKK